MTTRPYARAAALAAACLSLATAATAVSAPAALAATTATSGGAGLGSTGTSTGTTTSSTSTATTTGSTGTKGGVEAAPAGGPVSTSGNGFTLDTRAAGIYRRVLTFTGSAPAADAGQVLEIQRRAGRGAWHNTAHATIAADGSFKVIWRATQSGRLAFRATLPGDEQAAVASPASAGDEPASPALAVTIYQDSIATIYGPGLYGHKTACGEKLRPTTIGVASRTLKCGTKVSIEYRGRSVTVPVIDRGPFANGARWDLTAATAAALDDPETETIGAAVL